MRADRAEVDSLLAQQPDLVSRSTTTDLAAIVDAAEYRGLPSVALMLDLSFPSVTHRSSDGATALHAAAYAGRADVVHLLIQNGADIEARDGQFDSTPLCWASVGSGAPPRHSPNGDWLATVGVLLDAGAAVDGAWVAAKPPSDEVAALLLGYGAEPGATGDCGDGNE
jgi:ankyrin repeat protein